MTARIDTGIKSYYNTVMAQAEHDAPPTNPQPKITRDGLFSRLLRRGYIRTMAKIESANKPV